MYYRSSFSVVNLGQFLLELCPFWNLKYRKYTVFRTFLLHALTYWVEILHMTLFYCTTDQVRVSSIFIRPSSDGTYYGLVMSVRPSVSPSVRHSFPHFSPTSFDILIWNFVYQCIFMHVRSSSNAINFRHFLQELCSFLTSNTYKYAVFRTFLLHALTYWVEILYMTLF